MAQPAVNLASSNQSAGMSGNIEDIALIEQQVDSGLADLLEAYEPADKLEDIPFDLLNDRFSIDLSRPLPEYDSSTAKAYEAGDAMSSDRQLIAMVCDTQIPYRTNAIDALRGLNHPHMVSLREAGSVKLSTTKEIRQTLFIDRPEGRPLRDSFNEGRLFHERQVIDQILGPLINALGAMSEKGVSHGRINPANVYFKDRLTLHECVSEPQGLSQETLYEPIERLLAEPLARGAATQKSDAYALGMLALEALFGIDAFRELSREQLIRLMLEKGAYHTFIVNREISEAFTDFFRGTLTENKQERWGIDQLRNWLAGKRYNLIMPSLPKEATRSFTFVEKEFYGCRALANSIFNNWSMANKEIRQARLPRWLEMSAHQHDRAETVDRIITAYGGEYGGTARVNNEMLSRLIIALDPMGPMRYRSIAVNVDGLGLTIANYFKQHDNNNIQQLMEVIEADLPTFWADNYEGEKTQLTSNTLWTLQRVRTHLKFKTYGFGLERLVYDLNPTLPCQNHWILPYHATSAAEILNVLDNLAKTHARDTSLADRHLAAFIASKIDLSKEVKFNQLVKVPKLRDNPELIVMRIISMAQEKNGKKKMVGLATWAAMRVDKLLNEIHSRKLRNKIREQLKVAAKTGMVSRVLAVMVENDHTKEDHLGFTRANTLYVRNAAKIAALENRATMDKMATDFGGRIAVFIAFGILAITIFTVVDIHFY